MSQSEDWAEFADGLALWQEHRPQSPEDWIGVARRCNADGADRSVMNPILAALCMVLDRLDGQERG
jgi:hypothetical protein